MMNLGNETRAIIIEWGDKPIAYAKIEVFDDDYSETSETIVLREEHTKEEEDEFLKKLDETGYDDGYGLQYVFGFIVFEDGSWLERDSYDGSEWWEYREKPKLLV